LADEHSHQELFDLYKIALDEYRFEVKLNTDRMIHYVVANSAILTVATGLLKLDGARTLNVFVAFVFVAGAMTSHLGIRAIRKGHEYYHRTIHKKTVIEDLLGYTTRLKDYPQATLAIGTTKGQDAILRILHDPQAYLGSCEPKTGSIVHAAVLVLRALQLMDVAGSIAAVVLLWYRPPYIPWP
jgi:hypothetical protein